MRLQFYAKKSFLINWDSFKCVQIESIKLAQLKTNWKSDQNLLQCRCGAVKSVSDVKLRLSWECLRLIKKLLWHVFKKNDADIKNFKYQ